MIAREEYIHKYHSKVEDIVLDKSMDGIEVPGDVINKLKSTITMRVDVLINMHEGVNGSYVNSLLKQLLEAEFSRKKILGLIEKRMTKCKVISFPKKKQTKKILQFPDWLFRKK